MDRGYAGPCRECGACAPRVRGDARGRPGQLHVPRRGDRQGECRRRGEHDHACYRHPPHAHRFAPPRHDGGHVVKKGAVIVERCASSDLSDISANISDPSPPGSCCVLEAQNPRTMRVAALLVLASIGVLRMRFPFRLCCPPAPCSGGERAGQCARRLARKRQNAGSRCKTPACTSSRPVGCWQCLAKQPPTTRC